MNISLLRASLCGFFIFSLFGGKQIRASERTAKNINPIIAFDLHGVVLTHDWTKIFPTILHFNHKWDLIKNLYKLPIRRLCSFMFSSPSFEQFLTVVGQENNALHNLLVDLSVQQKVIPGIESLIRHLRDSGYTLHVLSNIGAGSFASLQIRFNGLFSNFSFIMTSNPDDHNGQLMKKPDPAFFYDYLEKIGARAEDIIFIDDRLENVIGARAIGMQAIHFKSPQQVATELMNLGVIPAGNLQSLHN